MENWTELVNWLITGGAVALVSWFVSWLVEDYAWWQNLKTQTKKLLILMVSLIIGSVAQFVNLHPELMVVLQPYLNSGVMIVMAWIASQVAHKADK